MWTVLIVILVIVLLMSLGILRLFWALLRPIFVFIYQAMISLIMKQGMSEMAARAIISLAVILIIFIAIMLV